ncbi:MAG: hypothetical protein QOG67_3959 [Verrucomicrobiota bacterium]|jgi:hypothetical protein
MKTLPKVIVILVGVAAIGMSSARADQPHMRKALDHLRAARVELKVAEHNKGGWRERAISHVDRAIADTETGMKTAR